MEYQAAENGEPIAQMIESARVLADPAKVCSSLITALMWRLAMKTSKLHSSLQLLRARQQLMGGLVASSLVRIRGQVVML